MKREDGRGRVSDLFLNRGGEKGIPTLQVQISNQKQTKKKKKNKKTERGREKKKNK